MISPGGFCDCKTIRPLDFGDVEPFLVYLNRLSKIMKQPAW